jgi:hypothetical protein
MLVSTCRVDLQADVRRGYTLHLTNLEDTRLDYLVTFVVTVRIPLMSSGPATGEVERFARFTGDGFSVEQPFRPSAVGKASPFDGATYTPASGSASGPGERARLQSNHRCPSVSG